MMMADQADKDGRDARAKAADIARQWTRRAVLGIVRESGGQTVTSRCSATGQALT